VTRTTFQKIKWGDGITVTDEGDNVIRVDAASPLPLPPTFYDSTDAGTRQDRWVLTTYQFRHAVLDGASVSAWTPITSSTIGSTLTLTGSGEIVYAFTVKSYIRGLTSIAPFTDLNNFQIPNTASPPRSWHAKATGQSGVVNYSATPDPADIGSENYQTIMVGIKPDGTGTLTEISFLEATTYVGLNPSATANIQDDTHMSSGDLVIVVIMMRQANAVIPNVTVPFQHDYTLVASSLSAGDHSDPHWVGVDQWVYQLTWP